MTFMTDECPCPACQGSRLETDPDTGVQLDDVCPTCYGEGTVDEVTAHEYDRAQRRHLRRGLGLDWE